MRGESSPTDLLIRFAVAPDGTLTPDLAEKLPGRGLWVTASTECLQTAIDKKLFSRALKGNGGQAVTVPATLIADITTLLTARVQSALGLAKKADVLVLGADGVRDAAGKGKLSYVLLASDASAAGAGDMDRRATPLARLPLTAAELGAAMGRDNTVYLGVKPQKAGAALLRDVKRLNSIVNQGLDE